MALEPQEVKFLEALHTKFADKKGKMSGLEGRIYDKLTNVMNGDGLTSQEEIKKIIADETEKSVLEAKRGESKFEDLVKVSTKNKVVGFLKKEINQATGYFFTDVVNGMDKVVESKITKEQENTLRNEVSAKEVVALATDEAKLPTIADMIKQAAGADNSLDRKELKDLMADPKFQAAAKAVDKAFKVTVSNTMDADEIKIGSGAKDKEGTEIGETINLKDLGIVLTDAKVDPKHPKTPDPVGFKQSTTEVIR